MRISFRTFLASLSGLLIFAASIAQAGGDGTRAAGIAVGGIGAAGAGVALADSAFSSSHCACLAATTGTCTPASAAGQCALLAANVGAMALMIMQSASGADTANAVTGDGGGFSNAGRLDPNLPLGPQLDPSFDCSGANSSTFACVPNGLDKLDQDADLYRNLLESGKLDVPPGETKDGLLSKLNNGLSNLRKAASGQGIDGSAYGDTDSNGQGNGKDGQGRGLIGRAAGAAATYSGGEDGSGGDLFGDPLGTIGKKASPSDTAGLGKVLWNGLLDQIDEPSGKSLTIWQRATRHYQGPKGRRAFTLARIEFIRKQALRSVQVARAPASVDEMPATVKAKGAKVAEKPKLRVKTRRH